MLSEKDVAVIRARYERERALLAKMGCKVVPFGQGGQSVSESQGEYVDFFAMPPLPRGEALDVEYAFKSVEEMEAFQRSIVCDSKGDVNE